MSQKKIAKKMHREASDLPYHFLTLKTLTPAHNELSVLIGFDAQQGFHFYYNQQEAASEKENVFTIRGEFQIHNAGIIDRHAAGMENPYKKPSLMFPMPYDKWDMSNLTCRYTTWSLNEERIVQQIDCNDCVYLRDENETKDNPACYDFDGATATFAEILYETMKAKVARLSLIAKQFGNDIAVLTLESIQELSEENAASEQTADETKVSAFSANELAFIKSFFAGSDQSIRFHCQNYIHYMNNLHRVIEF